MPYKRIVVDGKNYEYIIGRANVKVKGLGVFPRKQTETLESVIETIRSACQRDMEMCKRKSNG